MSNPNKPSKNQTRSGYSNPAAGKKPVTPSFEMIMNYAVGIPPLIDQLKQADVQAHLALFAHVTTATEAAVLIRAKESFAFSSAIGTVLVVPPTGKHGLFIDLVSCFSAMGHIHGLLKDNAIGRIVGAALFEATELRESLKFLNKGIDNENLTFFPRSLKGIVVLDGKSTSSVRTASIEHFMAVCCGDDDYSHPGVFPCGIYDPALDEAIAIASTLAPVSQDIHKSPESMDMTDRSKPVENVSHPVFIEESGPVEETSPTPGNDQGH